MELLIIIFLVGGLPMLLYMYALGVKEGRKQEREETIRLLGIPEGYEIVAIQTRRKRNA